MNLWLDDIRPPWQHGCLGWTWCKTAEQAQILLASGKVAKASLDHDLAWEHYPWNQPNSIPSLMMNGTQLVQWMIDTGNWPSKSCVVHSANPEGKERMERMIAEYRPYND